MNPSRTTPAQLEAREQLAALETDPEFSRRFWLPQNEFHTAAVEHWVNTFKAAYGPNVICQDPAMHCDVVSGREILIHD